MEKDTSIPSWAFPAFQSRQELGHAGGEHGWEQPRNGHPILAESPPAVRGGPGLPIAGAERATARGRCGRLSSHQSLVQGGSPDASPPRPSTPPQGRSPARAGGARSPPVPSTSTAMLRVMAVTGDVFTGDLQASLSPPHCPAAALVWGLLPQHKRKQPQAPAETLGKSWVHQDCALNNCPMASLTDGPSLHPPHLLWTLTSILKGKTMTSISHFLKFLANGETPRLLSGGS